MMTPAMKLIITFMLAAFLPMSFAAQSVYSFTSATQEQQYYQLIKEFRCLVCQNQNIADSDAILAQDLRAKTYEMVMENYSSQEITHFMNDRYGDFILYSPPITFETATLWLSPMLLLIFSIALFINKVVRSKYNKKQSPLNKKAQLKS